MSLRLRFSGAADAYVDNARANVIATMAGVPMVGGFNA